MTAEQAKNSVLLNMADEPMPTGIVTFEEFMDWADEDTKVEWVNGKIIVLGPFTIKHQELMGFLLILTSMYAQKHGLGEVLSFGYLMRLANSGRTPDLLFIAKKHKNRILNDYLNGAADLAVEIVLPDSFISDHETKFREYAEAGVEEYWIVDLTTKQAEFYQLDKHNQYQRQSVNAEGKYFSRELPGFWLKPEWLWEKIWNSVKVALEIDAI